jgi:hypothetical protein
MMEEDEEDLTALDNKEDSTRLLLLDEEVD